MDATQSPLRVLMVEDSPADAELVLRALRDEIDGPIEHARVASEAALRKALAEFLPDVVLSDFSMPGFSGQEALTIVRQTAPHLPFLFVSGTIGEELAIEALQRGAIDYVLKDNLRRLPSALERALRITREREERVRIERSLQESEERFRTIVETSQDWIWEMDNTGLQTYCNPTVTRILGFTPEQMVGRNALEQMHPEDRELVLRKLPDLVANKRGWRNWRLRWIHRDGSERILESAATPMLDADGALAGYRGIDQDVTELLQQQARIQHLARLHGVLSALGNAILRAGTRQGVLDAACRVAVEQGGFSAAAIGKIDPDGALRPLSRSGDPQVIAALCEIGLRTAGIDDLARMSSGMRVLRTGERMIVPDLTGTSLVPDWVRDRLRQAGVAAHALLPIGDPPGCVLGLYADTPQAFDAEEVALFERLASEIDYAIDFIGKGEQLEYLAYNNPVSGLSNRAALQIQLRPWLQREPLVLALLDIERFSAINESRGRAFGDALLREAGQRLRGLVGAAGLVAHVEADTFALAYRASGGSIEAETERLEQLLREFESEPFRIGDEEIRIDLRAGLAIAPDHGEDAEALEHSAAAALTEGGRRKLRLYAFTEELRGRAARRLGLEHELRLAIEHEQFELYYQPKFTADNQQLCGVEALLRWRHPERGLVSPGEFIPVLEDSELIVPVGRWVMREALRAALAWRQHHPGLRIAVNVSTRELRHSRFLDECRGLLQPHAGDQPLDIEITESLLMDDIAHSRQLLDALRDLGCRIAIDDFGTGYSSLSYLARLPIDELKIDLSFIAVIAQSPETMALVTNIISLAHSLGMKVVAEGVEEEEQAKLLRLLRCDVLQGYLLGRPEPAAAFEARLQAIAPR